MLLCIDLIIHLVVLPSVGTSLQWPAQVVRNVRTVVVIGTLTNVLTGLNKVVLVTIDLKVMVGRTLTACESTCGEKQQPLTRRHIAVKTTIYIVLYGLLESMVTKVGSVTVRHALMAGTNRSTRFTYNVNGN